MRLRTLLLSAIPALFLALPAAAQNNLVAPPVIIPDKAPSEPRIDDTPEELTWEEIPAGLRARAEPLLGRTQPQAVLSVDEGFTPETAFHPVDHGDLLLVQSVRPAGIARITSPVRNAEKYGPAGSVLWPGIGPEGNYWCWRRDDPATPQPEGNIYCYFDRDGDGVSELLMENNLWTTVPSSHFQFTSLGHDERVRGNASWAVTEGATGDMQEIVALQYDGIVGGAVSDDGKIGPGRVRFRLMAGPDRRRLSNIQTFTVVLDREGRGSHVNPNGIRFEIDGVGLNGVAQVKVTSGLPAGRALLRAPFTRENVIAIVSEFLNPDGSVKTDDSAPATDGAAPAPAPVPAAQ